MGNNGHDLKTLRVNRPWIVIDDLQHSFNVLLTRVLEVGGNLDLYLEMSWPGRRNMRRISIITYTTWAILIVCVYLTSLRGYCG